MEADISAASLTRAEFDKALVAALPQLKRYASKFCAGNTVPSDDLLQNAIVRMLVNWQTYIPIGPFGGWAYTVLRNTFRDMARKQIEKPFEPLDGVLTEVLGSPAWQYQQMEARDMLSALAVLPSARRSLLIESVVNGVTVHELASRRGCAVGTIKSQMSRARVRLQQAVAC